jgi:glutamate-ammonia-ligase adenylyltransferase
MAAFDRFGPAIVSEAKSTPWADNVIFGFERFVEVRGARDMLYELLDGKRPVIKLLSAVFSSSEQLTSVLLRQPDILDRLLASDSVENPIDRYKLADEFMSIAARKKPAEETMAALNMTRAAESLRLGLRRLLGLCGRKELMTALTALSEEFLRAVFVTAAEPGMKERWEDGWIALAAGKMGRREMNYGSDMDMAVFCEDDDDVKRRVTGFVQRVIRLSSLQTPSGSGYSVDLRLRPYGEKGELVTPFGAMDEYYRTRADAWERLALVGSRPIAGDANLGMKVMETITEFVTSPPLRHYESAKIASIRERITDEKVRPGSVDIKFGKGGLIEIEFICQWLTLEREGGWDISPDGEPFTTYTLARARREKLLSHAHVQELERAYDFYRAIEDALRMDKERAVNVIPTDAQALRRLARSVNAPGVGPERFVEAVKETMAKVREIYMEFVTARAGAAFSPEGR